MKTMLILVKNRTVLQGKTTVMFTFLKFDLNSVAYFIQSATFVYYGVYCNSDITMYSLTENHSKVYMNIT